MSLQFGGRTPELFVEGKLNRQGTSAAHLTGPLGMKCSSSPLDNPPPPDWAGVLPFQNCPGINQDHMLAGPIMFNEAIHTRAVGLSPKKVFNRKIKSFTVRDRYSKTVEEAGPLGGAVISGTKPVTARIGWKLEFTRVKREPIGF